MGTLIKKIFGEETSINFIPTPSKDKTPFASSKLYNEKSESD